VSIVTHEQLLELAGLPAKARISTLRKALKHAGIPHKVLGGRIFSTEDAITASMIGRTANAKKSEPNWSALDE
jgi:hypothetical protein